MSSTQPFATGPVSRTYISQRLRLHYADTLRAWRDAFMARRDEAAAMFDERFCRMWEYYLSYCEAGFRAGTIDVRQMVFAKSA